MCIPKPQVSAPPPVAVPSLQSASGIILGGADRGAAQIGRLQLRLGPGSAGAASSAATSASALSTGPTPATAAQVVTPGAPTATPGSTSQVPASGWNQGNNALRLGPVFPGRS